MMKRCLASFTVLLLMTPILTVSVFSQIELLEFDEDDGLEPEITFKREIERPPAPLKIAKPKKLEAEDLIHSGDIVDVDVLGSVEYDWRGEITPEGFLSGINFLEKSIFAACRTEDSLAKEIAAGYSGLLNNPSVVVKILDKSKRPLSTLYGAVDQPQRFKLKRKVFLNELIILSGGLTERASGEIRILRQPNANCVLDGGSNSPEPALGSEGRTELVSARKESELKVINLTVSDLLKGKKGSNPQVLYGDVINVLTAQPIYVFGAVENPTKIAIRKGLTVSRAIDSAGGLTKDANPGEITIFRRRDRDTELIEVDMKMIKSGDEIDIELVPFDVIQVGGRLRNDNKTPPIVRFGYDERKEISRLPLRVID
ncbi:MAG: hypothetical protein HKN25_11555 [Pyrinomonadaceae bacterium]|nr:hypothetical protein [Pyrinomonadaceae bacterium]